MLRKDIHQVCHLYLCHLTHPLGVVIAPPIRFSVVEFSKERGEPREGIDFPGTTPGTLGLF